MDINGQIEDTYDALNTPLRVMAGNTTRQILSNIETNLSTLIKLYQGFPNVDYREEIQNVNSILTKFQQTTITDEHGLNRLRLTERNRFYEYFKQILYVHTKGGPGYIDGGRMSYRSRKMKKHKKSKSHKKIRKGKRTKRRRY